MRSSQNTIIGGVTSPPWFLPQNVIHVRKIVSVALPLDRAIVLKIGDFLGDFVDICTCEGKKRDNK